MLTSCEYSFIIIVNSRKEVTIMMAFLYSNEYTHNNNQAVYQAETASCVKNVNGVHAAVFGVVCTFVFALSLIAVRLDVVNVLISVAIIISIIGIIICADNRIFKGNELLAVS